IWYYSSGIEMKDPFRQANDSKWQLDKYIQDYYGNKNIRNHCKFLSAVWFPGLDKGILDKLSLPTNANKELVLTQEDLDNPTATIERIFEIKIPYSDYYGNHYYVETDLTKDQADSLLRDILCPTFKILPSKTLELDYKRERFNSLIAEQCNLLNYLEEQRSAVINGAAGTGKTMIALEKARRHSDKGEKVLFLCFNSKLKDFLAANYNYPKVILVDVDKNAILDNNRLFYVGASRARFELSIVASLSEEECVQLIRSFNSVIKRNDPKLSLAKLLGCKMYNLY
ncbi:MAG: DEAD/DEAH box helicase family protein, partial [Firmicutes bacterium]|nr:DEAD/DEAH box helicase family protein [Bacillota bacterium]